ncbi:MAG: cytochrome c [Gemmatimonadetes bacterium]|nr:cytochrome c [Gemmatimonadota bacterium]
MKSPIRSLVIDIGAITLGFACSAGRDESGSSTATAGTPAAAATPEAAVVAPTGPVDSVLAERGKTSFQMKGCIGCHTIGGGKLTGPDLQGVTERREFAWVMAMVLNPDSMLKTDPVARQLFAQYMTPMVNMGVSREEARALFEYLRRNAP